MTEWTLGEKHLIAATAALAPSVHNTRHDPLGRDRLISCGAALEHVLVAMRVLGWAPEFELCHDLGHRDEVARMVATGRAEPSDVDLRRYRAVAARRSHRRPFADRRVDDGLRRELLATRGVDGVAPHVVSGPADVAALARLVSHSALVLRADRAYQRELVAWTASVRDPLPGSREFLILFETPDDGPLDHVRAGMAAERLWLAATAAGLVGSVLTQPFQLREVRAGLVEALSLNGFPQLLLRFGHP